MITLANRMRRQYAVYSLVTMAKLGHAYREQECAALWTPGSVWGVGETEEEANLDALRKCYQYHADHGPWKPLYKSQVHTPY